MGRVRWLLAGVLAALVMAPAANAAIFLTADATLDKGYVRLGVIGNTSLTDVHVGELVRGGYREIKALSLTPYEVLEPYGELGGEQVPRAAQWRCDRLERVFQAYGTNAAGVRETSEFTVRTPSCANRLRLSVPPRASRSGRVRIELEDTFRRGDIAGRLCRRTADRPARCSTLRVPSRRRFAATTLELPREGRWAITFTAPHQKIRRAVAVGVAPRPADLQRLPGIVATGDSLMQGLDAVVEDRLGGLATVNTDVRIGSGLSRVVNGDWSRLPGRQVREFAPEATIVFLGSNDGATMRRSDGSFVACCGEDYVREYTRRARRAMTTYVQRGQGKVYWLALPAARDDLRTTVNAAVNKAVSRAAATVKGARVLDMNAIFTPTGVYTDYIRYRGKPVRVRQQDGIHLTTRGAEIAADYVIDQLEKDGVL